MATASEVKTGLDNIAAVISQKRNLAKGYKAGAGEASTALGALATDYADVIATINGYGNTDPFEVNAKAELAKLTDEFGALVSDLNTIAAIDLG